MLKVTKNKPSIMATTTTIIITKVVDTMVRVTEVVEATEEETITTTIIIRTNTKTNTTLKDTVDMEANLTTWVTTTLINAVDTDMERWTLTCRTPEVTSPIFPTKMMANRLEKERLRVGITATLE